MSRSLVLMRHAKAEGFGDDDHARRLTARGRRDAGAAGAWLAEQDRRPTHAMVSAATRTRETWAAVAEAAGLDVEPDFDAALYSAGPDSALEILRDADPAAEVLLVIGHNPTMGYLGSSLSDDHPDPAAFRGVASGFPPAAVAVYDVDVAWADLDEGTARLRAFWSPEGR